MTDELITFETAKLAHQADFDIPCHNTFDIIDGRLYSNMNSIGGMVDTYNRPTQSLLQRWIRETHNIHVYVTRTRSRTKYSWVICNTTPISFGRKWNTYEASLEEALQEALQLIINSKSSDNLS
jgi:hypothetical protein